MRCHPPARIHRAPHGGFSDDLVGQRGARRALPRPRAPVPPEHARCGRCALRSQMSPPYSVPRQRDPYAAGWAELRLRRQFAWVAIPMALAAIVVLWAGRTPNRLLAVPLGLPALILFFRLVLARCPHCRGLYAQKGPFDAVGGCRQCGIP